MTHLQGREEKGTEVERFFATPTEDNEGVDFTPHPKGYWVRFEDYNGAEAQLESLRGAATAVTDEMVPAGLSRRLPDNDHTRSLLEALAAAASDQREEN